jgi:allantoin racemase
MRIANIVSPGAEYLQPDPAELAPGVTSEVVVTRMDVPMASDPLRLALKDLVYVEAAVRAERAGCDAIFVNTVADYGLPLIRSAVSIPVAGAGESAIAEALGLGGTFAIVTVWPSSTRIYYDRVLRDTGSREQCHSIRYVLEEAELGQLGGGRDVMLQAGKRESSVADRVLRACKDAAATGASAVILGCTCMTGLVGWLRANLEVAVVSPLHTGIGSAQAAVADNAARGDTTLPGPAADSVARVLAAVGAMAPMGASVTSAWAATAAEPECGDTCAAISRQ